MHAVSPRFFVHNLLRPVATLATGAVGADEGDSSTRTGLAGSARRLRSL
jgi:hypothetical protein